MILEGLNSIGRSMFVKTNDVIKYIPITYIDLGLIIYRK